MRCPGSARDTRGGKLGAPYPHDASRPLVLVLVLHEATARAAPTPGDGARLTGGASSRLDEHHRLDLRRHPITGYMYGVDTLVIVVVVAGFAVKDDADDTDDDQEVAGGGGGTYGIGSSLVDCAVDYMYDVALYVVDSTIDDAY